MVESPISFRLSKEEMEKLNSIKGEKSASTFCKDIIVEFLSTSVNNPVDITDVSRQLQQSRDEIEHKNQLLEMAHQRIIDLQSHNGFLISQIQQQNQQLNRLLLTEPESQPEPKAWWKLW